MSLYPLIRNFFSVAFHAWFKLRVEGREHFPKEGPFIVLTNHVSNLDGPLVHTMVPRLVYSMTKSTQFASGISRLVLRNVGTFPTRRYEVDPQAVRVALRYLKEGRGVGIHPEGERSWDGRLQPLRLGTVRLILKAGVPVIPCGIVGTYEIWPRWGSFPWRLVLIPFFKRPPVTVRFGEPLLFGRHDSRASREALLDPTLGTITAALEDVSRP